MPHSLPMPTAPQTPATVPHILGVGTAHPPHRVGQPEVRALVEQMFSELPGLERLIGVFENTGIESRYLGAPLPWFGQDHSFEAKNALWASSALELSLQASRKALAASGLSPRDIGAVVWVSTTGIATPSLETYLIQQLGLPLSAVRMPLWGLGCAGGAAGLARAAELARLYPHKAVLLVAVEMCSLTFIRNDRSKSNLVATSLFADGAAAVVVGYAGGQGSVSTPRPQIVGSFSRLLPDSYEVMGWDVEQGGLKVRFAQSIPSLVQGELGNLIREGLDSFGLKAEDVGAWVLHPGGAKVLSAYAGSLGIDRISLEASRGVLRRYGNMSSPTVLFVLEAMLGQVKPGSTGVLLALGPGFCAEGVVLQW